MRFYLNNIALLCAFIFVTITAQVYAQRPHIILIVADDLGWNDVGFHGSIQIPTPNIDALAYAGVILNSYYVQPICTPSRGALMSGMHPIHTGLQHETIGASQPCGLPLEYTLLPGYLRSLGYTTRHVGKWHIGSFMKDYTPTYRGFDSHYGYWTGRIDYYDHTALESMNFWGYDFRRNMEVDRRAYGHYTTDLLTEESVKVISDHNASTPLFLYLAHLAVHSGNHYDPLQAPDDLIKKFSYISDEHRRKFAAMLWKLDEGIGQVIGALEAKEMLNNSIIVFTTDNGGPAAGFNDNAASNWPLRGVKAGMWEGGVRGASFIWSPLINNPGRVSTEMMQIIDWLPTLYNAAGGNPNDLPPMDGMDIWSSIQDGAPSPRTQILHNIDPVWYGASVRVGDWKLIYNATGYEYKWNLWYGPSGRLPNETFSTDENIGLKSVKKSVAGKAVGNIMPKIYRKINRVRKAAEILCDPIPLNATLICNNSSTPCLFHIPSDPCEYYDVSESNPSKVIELQNILNEYNATAVPNGNKPNDARANPVYWNYTWTNWVDYSDDSWFSKYRISYTINDTIDSDIRDYLY